MKAVRQRLATITAVFLCTLSAQSVAQTSAEPALAESLFREAERLFDAGRISEACAKLAESQRLDPKPGTLLNLATCHEKEGKTASAWAEYTQLAVMAERAGQRDRKALAEARAADLEKRLSRLRIEVGASAQGGVVELDGTRIAQAALGSPLPVDPGQHVISVSAPGKVAWSQRTTISPGPASMTLTVPELADAPKTAQPIGSARPTERLDSTNDASSVRTIGIVAAVSGAATLAVGGGFGLVALSKKGDAEDAGCRDAVCPNADAGAARDSARDAGTVSTVLFVAGGVLAVAGVTLWLVAPSARASSASVGLGARARANDVSIAMRGAW